MFAICIRIHQTFILRKNTNTFLYKSYDRQNDIVTGRQTDRQTDRRTGGQAGGLAGRQADRQTDRQTDRQKPGQTNKQKSGPHLPYYLTTK